MIEIGSISKTWATNGSVSKLLFKHEEFQCLIKSGETHQSRRDEDGKQWKKLKVDSLWHISKPMVQMVRSFHSQVISRSLSMVKR